MDTYSSNHRKHSCSHLKQTGTSTGPNYRYNVNRCLNNYRCFYFTGCDLVRNMFSLRCSLPSLVLIIVILGFCSVTCVQCQDSGLEGQVMQYLGDFGYVNGPSAETGNYMAKEDFVEALKNLQRMGGIPATGEIDQRTLALMKKPRCGNKDDMDSNITVGRRKRYVLAPTKWKKKDLTYRIVNYTPDLPIEKVRKAIYDAFKIWSDHTELTFTETRGSYADIIIKFASGYHQDGYPFDGKGLVLAHAFFPGEDKGGDTHFDDDEKWIVNSKEEGVDLFMVAAHEFGHALGLGHSSEPGALMYPWYQGFDENFRLPYDDIKGIQHLYGGRGPLPPRPPTKPPRRRTTESPRVVTRRPRPRPRPPKRKPDGGKKDIPINPCEHRFDAIAVLRREVFLFMDDIFYRLDSRGLINGEPTKIHSFWYGLPHTIKNIDAVFERPTDGKIVFFKGDRYWIFNGNNLIGNFPKQGLPIANFGLPPDIKHLDAVFIWGYNKRTYLISGDMYWKLNEKNDYIELDYPRDMSIWRKVPTPVDSAFKYWDNKTYFFKKDYYYEFYDNKMIVRKGFPKLIREHWLGCNSQGQYKTIQNEKSNLQPLENGNGSSSVIKVSTGSIIICVLAFMTSLFYVHQ